MGSRIRPLRLTLSCTHQGQLFIVNDDDSPVWELSGTLSTEGSAGKMPSVPNIIDLQTRIQKNFAVLVPMEDLPSQLSSFEQF